MATDTVHSVIQAAEAGFTQGDAIFEEGDVFVLGPETRGLPPEVLGEFKDAHRLRLPMQAQSRSLNLSNAAAVIVYEAWRQLGFHGGV